MLEMLGGLEAAEQAAMFFFAIAMNINELFAVTSDTSFLVILVVFWIQNAFSLRLRYAELLVRGRGALSCSATSKLGDDAHAAASRTTIVTEPPDTAPVSKDNIMYAAASRKATPPDTAAELELMINTKAPTLQELEAQAAVYCTQATVFRLCSVHLELRVLVAREVDSGSHQVLQQLVPTRSTASATATEMMYMVAAHGPPDVACGRLIEYMNRRMGQMLGEHLHPQIVAHCPFPATAALITGMLLEMDHADLLLLLREPESLREKIFDCMTILEVQQGVLQVIFLDLNLGYPAAVWPRCALNLCILILCHGRHKSTFGARYDGAKKSTVSRRCWCVLSIHSC